MATTIGITCIFGTCKPKRLRGFPQGKIKLRMRNNDYMTAYVRNKEGITAYRIIEKNDNWYPAFEIARNHNHINNET